MTCCQEANLPGKQVEPKTYRSLEGKLLNITKPSVHQASTHCEKHANHKVMITDTSHIHRFFHMRGKHGTSTFFTNILLPYRVALTTHCCSRVAQVAQQGKGELVRMFKKDLDHGAKRQQS